MTDADGGLHTYTYDVMRRLTGVINPLGERTTYAYDLNGRRTSVQLANGTRTSYVYDLGSRVQSVHTLRSDDSTVSKFEYEYDGNGRRTSVLEADGSRVTWTYDRISQVTAEWRTGTNPYRHTFTYDSVGNRTLKIEDGARTTLVYDACNQLATSEDVSGTTTFTYDGNGNQTVLQKPSGDRTTQVWDYENRLVKTIQPSGGVTSMAYDADGLRLKLEEPTGTKLFVWDDQNYLAETDAAGTTQAAFTTEPSTYGSLISHRKAGASTTYHFDALGSTRALTDESEAVLDRYNYSAFGTLLGSPTLLTPFLWGGMVGYYWDAALATQYIRARHYQPAIARWISLDPIGFAGGDANLFRYVGNSPTSGVTSFHVRFKQNSLDSVLLPFDLTTLDPSGNGPMCKSEYCSLKGPFDNYEGIYGVRAELIATPGKCCDGATLRFHWKESHATPPWHKTNLDNYPPQLKSGCGEPANKEMGSGYLWPFRFGNILDRNCSAPSQTRRKVNGCWVAEITWECKVECKGVCHCAGSCGPSKSTLGIYPNAWHKDPNDLSGFSIQVDTLVSYSDASCVLENCGLSTSFGWLGRYLGDPHPHKVPEPSKPDCEAKDSAFLWGV